MLNALLLVLIPLAQAGDVAAAGRVVQILELKRKWRQEQRAAKKRKPWRL